MEADVHQGPVTIQTILSIIGTKDSDQLLSHLLAISKRTINPVHAHRVAISPNSTRFLRIWTLSGGNPPLARRYFGYLGRPIAASPMLRHVLWT